MDTTRRRKLVIIGLITVAVMMVVTIIIALTRPDQYESKLAPNQISDNPTAVIVNGDELYRAIGNYTRYGELRSDIAKVAKINDSGAPKTVIYTITSFVAETPTLLVVEGEVNPKKTSLIMRIELLDGDRMKIVGLYGKDKKDISSDFSSNSVANQVAATMPKETNDYTISYISTIKLYIITPKNNDPATTEAAKADLRTMLGDAYSDDIYSIFYPNSAPAPIEPDTDPRPKADENI
jgi:hypothetical protein